MMLITGFKMDDLSLCADLDLSRPNITRFSACDSSHRLQYEMTRSQSGSCHLIEVRTLAFQALTLYHKFLAIVYFPAIRHDLSENFAIF